MTPPPGGRKTSIACPGKIAEHNFDKIFHKYINFTKNFAYIISRVFKIALVGASLVHRQVNLYSRFEAGNSLPRHNQHNTNVSRVCVARGFRASSGL